MTTPLPGTFGVTPTFGAWYDRIIARGIQWTTATRDQYGTWHDAPVNHAVVYVGKIAGHPKPQLVEARPGGARLSNWDEYGDNIIWADKFGVKVDDHVVPLELTEAERHRIAHMALQLAFRKVGYGYRDYLAIALAQKRLGALIDAESVFAEPEIERWVLDRLSRPDKLICSQLVDYCYAQGGVPLFTDHRPTGLVSPADLYSLIIPTT